MRRSTYPKIFDRIESNITDLVIDIAKLNLEIGEVAKNVNS